MGRMGRFDASGLKRFQKELEKLDKNMNTFMESCARELAARLLRLVVKRTPVGDYTHEIEVTAKRDFGETYVIEIVNPVEYASYVEYGHRTANRKGWVKGRFMMTISEQELQRIAPKVLENKIKKYFRECLK